MRIANSSSELPGTAWENVQFIKVDFRWLALPVFVYASITVLLFCTVFKSRRSDAPIWKQSYLGLLQGENSKGGPVSRSNLKNTAKQDDVKLVRAGGTWDFVAVEGISRRR